MRRPSDDYAGGLLYPILLMTLFTFFSSSLHGVQRSEFEQHLPLRYLVDLLFRL
jgi:hypothetical protein